LTRVLPYAIGMASGLEVRCATFTLKAATKSTNKNPGARPGLCRQDADNQLRIGIWNATLIGASLSSPRH